MINLSNDPFKLLYDRSKKGYGVPVEGHKFMGTDELAIALREVKRNLERMGWLPFIEGFLSGGTQVDKGSKTNAHRLGIAIDFDGVILKPNPLDEYSSLLILTYGSDVPSWTIEDNFHEKYNWDLLTIKSKTRFACLLSLTFGVVLGDFYDKHHQDHLHCDLSKKPGWRGMESQVGLLQATLNAWYGEKLAIDGDWGKLTDGAVLRWVRLYTGLGIAVETLEMNLDDKPNFWDKFLNIITFDPPK